jgi:hypothetical protein
MVRRLVRTALALSGTGLAYAGFGRPWQLRWGATDGEVNANLSGDHLIPQPDLVATRAITVRAPTGAVWPWVVQLGQGRGGFYSYDRLENLFGCDIHSADRVVSDWQEVRVGDQIRLYPGGGLSVAFVAPGSALVLCGAMPAEQRPPYDFSWAFVLREQPDGNTRLVVRERYAYRSRWASLLVEPVELVSFVMHQKMLRGIRDRAERTGFGQLTR